MALGTGTIVNVIGAMSVGGTQVALNASKTLEAITGERRGTRLDDWVTWWEDEGQVEWP